MLAYILWHWPFPQVSTEDYESGLGQFHQSLSETTISGFKQSIVFRNRGTPWIGEGERGYEDWYFIAGTAAMDFLNEAAVSAARKAPHDNTAHAAAGAAGGLYQFQQGSPDFAGYRYVSWLAKPRSTGYDKFYDDMRRWTGQPKVSLWRRQMVLGPTPEIALFCGQRLSLPPDLEMTLVELDQVWP